MSYEYYKFRIYPTPLQEVLLNEHFGAVRFVHNWALEKYIALKGEKRSLAKWKNIATCKALTELKQDNVWMYAVGSQSLWSSVQQLGQHLFTYESGKMGLPHFKSKKDNACSFCVTKDFEFDFRNRKLRLPKFSKTDNYDNRLCFVLSKRVSKGKIGGLTISRNAVGQYYVSFPVSVDNDPPEVKSELLWSTAVGYDFGIGHFLTSSTGERIESPGFLVHMKKRLKRERRRLKRRQVGSRNSVKQQWRIDKLRLGIQNRRKDFLHKLSTRLVEESQFDFFCVEDLDLRKLIGEYGNAVRDLSFGTFVHYLTYKCEARGKRVLKIDRFSPTSQVCSTCGHKRKFSINQRMYVCGYCGTVIDRDVNAAINIRDAAVEKYRADFFSTAGTAGINACGEQGSVRTADAQPDTPVRRSRNSCQTSGAPADCRSVGSSLC